MNVSTKLDPITEEWSISDDVVQLREWGTDRVHGLPPDGTGLIGTDEGCRIRLEDQTRRTSRRHARLRREAEKWIIEDAGSKNGLWLDGARRDAFLVEPGVEIGIGGLTLLAESTRLIAIRRFLARLLGWTSDRKAIVDHALRSVRMAASRRVGLVLSGDVELVATAHALHRRVLGPRSPVRRVQSAPPEGEGVRPCRREPRAWDVRAPGRPRWIAVRGGSDTSA